MFHLLALSHAEEFWPIIRREISARNFFLYCESKAAETSTWVQRERNAVNDAAATKRIRTGSVRVDAPELDFSALDEFLAKTRVFPSYSRLDETRIKPFIEALEQTGFRVFLTPRDLPYGEEWKDAVEDEIRRTAENGWILVFLTKNSLNSSWVLVECQKANAARAKFVPVLLENIVVPEELNQFQIFDATIVPSTAAQRLAEELLSRPV